MRLRQISYHTGQYVHMGRSCIIHVSWHVIPCAYGKNSGHKITISNHEIPRPPYEITHDGKLLPYDDIRGRELWSLLVPTENLGFQGLLLYNFACSCCSAATCAAFLHGLWHSEHIFDKTPQPALQLAFRLYWLCKLGELLDTVFMVLRHRRHQISVLHVYHHASMLLLSEFAWQHSPWPAIAVLLALNSFVHVFLYIYYALSTCPQVSVPSRWRQALTEIQILQFVVAMIYCLVGYFNHGFCVYSLGYGAVMTFLFSHFYYYAYVNRASTKQCMQ